MEAFCIEFGGASSDWLLLIKEALNPKVSIKEAVVKFALLG